MALSKIQVSSMADNTIHGRRNIIINGAMQVAQRATSASASNGSYVSLDRYLSNVSGGGAYTFSQETDTPSGQGFKNSMKVSVDTADSSIASGDHYIIQYRIEGQDVAHLMLGTSDAVKVTLSFWVKSSLTGNFGASLINNGADRSYPFQYNISTANTWQKITKTIQLDTSGTWLTTNGVGLKIMFDFGSGTTYQGTADVWGGANYHTASSSVQLIGTSSATWYCTGIQLEVGSQATPFEHRSFGEELQLCKRYYEKSFPYGTTPSNSSSASTFSTYQGIWWVDKSLNSSYKSSYRWDVEKRATPSVTPYGNSSGHWYSPTSGWHDYNDISHISPIGFLPRQQASGSVIEVYGHYGVHAEL